MLITLQINPPKDGDNGCAVGYIYVFITGQPHPDSSDAYLARLIQPLPPTLSDLRGCICALKKQSQYFNFILYLKNENKSITFRI